VPKPTPNNVEAAGNPNALGLSYSSLGSTAFVLNANTGVVTEPANDPWAVVNADAAGHGNCRIITTGRRFAYLHLMHAWTTRNTSSSTLDSTALVTTDPIVRVYGRIPNRNNPNQQPIWPSDDSPKFRELLLTDGMWRPLLLPDAASALIPLDSGSDEAAHYSVGGNDFWIGLPSTLFICGCDAVLCTVDDAAVFNETGALGVVLGHLSG
jgi:hypothetical protein